MSILQKVPETTIETINSYTHLLSTLNINIMVGKGKDKSLQIPMTTVDGKDNEVMEIKPLLDDSEEERGGEPVEEKTSESLCGIFSQVSLPFLIAGFGTVGAGLVLDLVQHWKVFRDIPEMFILVPSLLGLKGNLEMTLASRLSTQANLGNLDNVKDQWKMATGNLVLIQCQATVVGFLASVFAAVVDYVGEKEFNVDHAILLCSSSLFTASVASFILGLVTIGVVILSRKYHINPDNVAAPVAASLGDVITLTLLANSSRILYSANELRYWIQVPIILALISLVPLWWTIAHRNEYTRHVLYTGWTPVISAVVIASAGGYILDTAASQYGEMAVFQPVINGVGGNLAAVQASRISTSLHQRVKLGVLPLEDSKRCISPFSAFFGKSIHVRTANLLLLMAVPGHLIFLIGIHVLKVDSPDVPSLFYLLYPMAALIQVCILMYTAYCMIHWMWKWSIDPDNSAIPYLTALGDLLGTALLAVVFYILDPSRSNTQNI